MTTSIQNETILSLLTNLGLDTAASYPALETPGAG